MKMFFLVICHDLLYCKLVFKWLINDDNDDGRHQTVARWIHDQLRNRFSDDRRDSCNNAAAMPSL